MNVTGLHWLTQIVAGWLLDGIKLGLAAVVAIFCLSLWFAQQSKRGKE